jgi:preprotein translocase subunit YajC
MKKYWVEIVLVILFAGLIYWTLHQPQPKPSKDYQKTIDSIGEVLDSVSKIERIQITKTTLIKNYYDSTKIIIINLPDSIQPILLRANIQRFSYLLKQSGH